MSIEVIIFAVQEVFLLLQVSRLPPGNMLAFEPSRFTALHNNQRFLSLRTPEVVSLHYQVCNLTLQIEFD
jgi:hypothetical protein